MIGLIENSSSAPKERGSLLKLVESIFCRGGYLESILALDHRPEQATMAQSVAVSLESNQPLLFEAGTGVGKGLAYLIPGILHSVDSERPFIISSYTISLQQQLQQKDLKICRKLFELVPALQRYGTFKTALMIGKSNYCCSKRLSNALTQAKADKQAELFKNDEKADLSRIAQWHAVAKNGVIQEISPSPLPELWDSINADSSTCSRKNCDPSTCFYQRARNQIRSANCVIVNHSLLFSLINAGMQPEGNTPGILLADDFVVLDEAHRISDIATDHFGVHVSSYALERALKRIYNPRSKRGTLRIHGQTQDLKSVSNAIDASHEFFRFLGENFLDKKSIQRVYEPDCCDNIISGPLKEVSERLGALIQKSDIESVQDELRDHRRRILSYRDAISGFITFAEEDYVQWLERRGKAGQNITLRSAPLNIAPYLREHIFCRNTSVVLTSATLSDGINMDTYKEKIGAQATESEIVYSPFDYEKNCHIYIASDSPQPEAGQGRLDLDYLSNMICWCARRVEGGTLVLFTSHYDLRKVRERTEDFFKKIERPLFTQGDKMARSEITRKFTDAGNGVLFGTDSFWTGVDVPGPALSQVIIARLPFESPGHPVSEARTEYIRARGGNPFSEMIIPDALVKFRQGIGRLIRRKKDIGNIVVLDSRILNKSYGVHFLEALPVKQYERFTRENRDSVFVKLN